MMKTFLSMAFGVAFLAQTGAAFAEAYEVETYQNNWNTRASSWKSTLTVNDPGNGNDCAANGSVWDDDTRGVAASFGTPEPLSGSKTRTRYMTSCKNGSYLIVKLTTELSDCTMWVCSVRFKFQAVHNAGVTYEHNLTTDYGGLLKLKFTNP